MKRVLALVLLTLVPALAVAQDPPADVRPSPPRGRDDAFKMVDAYIVSNLQEGLGLSDEEFVKLLPSVRKLQNDRRELAQRRIRSLRELRKVLEAGSATEGRVVELLQEVKAVEQEQALVIRRDVDAIDAALTPIQQAKFRVLEMVVEQKIRGLMEQIREGRELKRRERKQESPSP